MLHRSRTVRKFVAAPVCLVCAMVAWRMLPVTSSPAVPKNEATSSERPFALGVAGGLLVGIGLVHTGKVMPQTFFGLFAEQVLRTPAWVTGLSYGASALGLCVAAPFGAKRFEDRPRANVLRQVEWLCWGCAAIVAVQATSHALTVFVMARVLWGVCLGALLPVFYGLLSSQANPQDQGLVLGAGNSAAKAGALLGIGAGGLTLAWMPIQYVFWPVVMVYALAAMGLAALRRTRNSAHAVKRSAAA